MRPLTEASWDLGGTSDFAGAAVMPGVTWSGGREFRVRGDPPGPEMREELFGLPPVMLTPGEVPIPPPDVAPFPPGLVALPFAPPFPGVPFGEPPGAPGCVPSGEIETREERFPGGICAGGGTGAGIAESAITR